MAGSEFSVLKPDNATGNFTKIAQRIPLRIELEPDQSLAEALRPGMSVEVAVDTALAPVHAPDGPLANAKSVTTPAAKLGDL